MTETDATLFTTLPNKATTAHTIMINKLPPKKWQKQVTEKTFQEMYINVGMANCEKRPKQERDDIRFTHIAIPTSFYPSPTHGPTQYPLHADYSSSSTQSTKFHITVSITQQLHHMHKYNNSKSLFSHSCNGSIITKQQSKITKTPKQCFSKQPTATSEPDLSSFVVQWFEQVRAHTSRPPHATACSFHTYFHIITTCLICYMMH